MVIRVVIILILLFNGDNCDWQDWESWYPCSVTCGYGVQYRFRQCYNSGLGADCTGYGAERVICYSSLCPVNGNWNVWSNWTTCNSRCGEGHQNRTRECNLPSPAYGGKDCGEFSTEIRSCINCCPENTENPMCCSPGVVVGVGILGTVVTIVTFIVMLKGRERLLSLGVKENNKEIKSYDNLQQTSSQPYENVNYSFQHNVTGTIELQVNPTESNDENYENLQI